MDVCEFCGNRADVPGRALCRACAREMWDEQPARDEPSDPGWEEDERDVGRIQREWDAYDRDPPGS